MWILERLSGGFDLRLIQVFYRRQAAAVPFSIKLNEVVDACHATSRSWEVSNHPVSFGVKLTEHQKV